MEAKHNRDESVDRAVPSLTVHLTEVRTAVPLVRAAGEFRPATVPNCSKSPDGSCTSSPLP